MSNNFEGNNQLELNRIGQADEQVDVDLGGGYMDGDGAARAA